MKKVLSIITFIFAICTLASAQIRFDLNSDLNGRSLSSFNVQPQVWYYPFSTIGFGAGVVLYDGDSDFHSISVNARKYWNKSFVQAGVNFSSENSTGINLSVGQTVWLGRFYLDPQLVFVFGDSNTRLGFGLGLGFRT